MGRVRKERNDSEGNLKRRWQTLNGDCGRMESSRLRGKGNTVWILAVVLPYPGDLWRDLTFWPLLSTFIKWAGWYPNLLCKWNEEMCVLVPSTVPGHTERARSFPFFCMLPDLSPPCGMIRSWNRALSLDSGHRIPQRRIIWDNVSQWPGPVSNT